MDLSFDPVFFVLGLFFGGAIGFLLRANSRAKRAKANKAFVDALKVATTGHPAKGTTHGPRSPAYDGEAAMRQTAFAQALDAANTARTAEDEAQRRRRRQDQDDLLSPVNPLSPLHHSFHVERHPKDMSTDRGSAQDDTPPPSRDSSWSDSSSSSSYGGDSGSSYGGSSYGGDSGGGGGGGGD